MAHTQPAPIRIRSTADCNREHYPSISTMPWPSHAVDRCGSGLAGLVRHAVTRREATDSMLAAAISPAHTQDRSGLGVIYQLPETIPSRTGWIDTATPQLGLIYLLTIIYIWWSARGIIFSAKGAGLRWVMGHDVAGGGGVWAIVSLPWPSRPGRGQHAYIPCLTHAPLVTRHMR